MGFPARYAGKCGRCEQPFHEATMIEYTDNDQVVHAGGTCPEPEPTNLDLRRGEQVCPVCWLVHRPGPCPFY